MTLLKTESDISDVIKNASGPLRIQGAGSRGVVDHLDGDVLSTKDHAGITLYDPGALTIVAKAGTPIAEIEATLARENQRLAFEPADYRPMLGTNGEPTIGGVIAANISGPRRIAVGAARDFLLGVRFVDGNGTIVKNGGRVMKNVTGYDLVKLMAGSFGTMGVLTEVSLKVLPNVQASATLRLPDLPVDQSIAAMSRALGSPFDVTGAAQHGTDTLIRVEGFAASVAYRAEALQSALASFGNAEILTDCAGLWQQVRDQAHFADHATIWRVSLKPSAAPGFIAALNKSHSFDYALDWGGGLIWIASQDTSLHAPLQALTKKTGGHATLIKSPKPLSPMFQPQPAPLAAIAQGLRDKFDPRGILNQGLMT